MRTIAVISDTHEALLPENIHGLFPEDASVLTLGDISMRELSLIRKHYRHLGGVRGNCDPENGLTEIQTVEIDGLRFFLSHEPPVVRLLSRREDRIQGYDAVLFGHLHRRVHVLERNIVYFSPGAFSGPRDGNDPSVGIIEISKGRPRFMFREVPSPNERP